MHRHALVTVAASVADVERVLASRFDAVRDRGHVDGDARVVAGVDDPDGVVATWRATVRDDPTTDGTMIFAIAPQPDGATQLGITAAADVGVPFFRSIVESLVALHYERVLIWTEAVVAHELGTASSEPDPPKPVPLLPNVPFSRAQTALLTTAGFAIAVATFGQSIVGQFVSDIAHSFGTNDDGMGVSLAILRSGFVLALVAAALADRVGRRRVTLGSLVGLAVANVLSALAPTLALFTVAQTFTRGFAAAAVIAAGIAAVEEAPEGGRAYATSILALTGGAGFTLTVLLFPLGDRFPSAWRLVFLLSAACVLFNRSIGRALVESRRYERLVATNISRGRLREVFGSAYALRFWLLAAAAFLTNLLAAPSSQFMNKYLTDVHHYSHSSIVGLRAATTALPGFIGLILAGRLSERYGRRPVAAVALAVGAVVRAVFFLASGPVLWIASALGDLTLSCGFIAIGVLNTELFPTETRGTSNGFVALIGVMGSAVGLLLAGGLSDPLGGLGRAIALTTIGTFVAAILVVPFLPEAAHRELDEISPSVVDDP